MILHLKNNALYESVSPEEVEKAIDNRQGVLITYKGEENNDHTGARYIEPYVYGLTSKNNPAIRVFQYYGDTKKGAPSWKLLKLDNILSWEPTQNTFDVEPQARGWVAKSFNGNDKLLPTIYKTVEIGSLDGLTDLDMLRMKTQSLKQNKPVNINDINNINQKQNGPIGTNKPTVGNPNNEEPTRNTDTPLNTDGTSKNNKSEAPIKQEPKQNGPVFDDTTNPNKHKPEELMSNEKFMDMLKRNMSITQKEKKKMNKDLSGNVLNNNEE